MLVSLKLKNFRQHEEKNLTFNEGVVVIRGRNEGGKSTIVESMLYALYGAKALRSPLADTVTWGMRENDLAVEAVIEIDSRLYNFKRSKSGAECFYDQGTVTGQTEVSNFAAEILGADANVANQLMLANQNNLRGMLESGPKAVSEMIEGLSDFDLFDRIMEAADRKLMMGSPALLEGKLREAESNLENLTVEKLDFSSLAAEIEELKMNYETYQANVARIEPLQIAADKALASVESEWKRVESMKTELATLESKLESVKVDFDKSTLNSKCTVKASDIEAKRASYANAENAAKLVAAFEEIQSTHYPELFWEGTKEEFEKELEDNETKASALSEKSKHLEIKSAAITSNIQSIKEHLQHEGKCKACGQDILEKASITEHRAKLQADIDNLEHELTAVNDSLAEAKAETSAVAGEIADLKSLKPAATKYERMVYQHGWCAHVDKNFYPPKITWDGDKPSLEVDVEALKAEIVTMEVAIRAADVAKMKAESLKQSYTDINDRITQVKSEIVAVGKLADLELAQQASFLLSEEMAQAKWHLYTTDDAIQAKTHEKEYLIKDYESALKLQEFAKSNLDKARKDLDTLSFNNALIKKVRAARPIIADKLWNTVLHSVSAMFSQMRGETSVVTKGKDGFAVNGATVASLSGSTLDLLGLALRCSLVKSFLPHISMLVLDEPAAAMDDNRATSMLGFVAAAGFNQTILITHEAVSEQFADNLITL